MLVQSYSTLIHAVLGGNVRILCDTVELSPAAAAKLSFGAQAQVTQA